MAVDSAFTIDTLSSMRKHHYITLKPTKLLPLCPNTFYSRILLKSIHSLSSLKKYSSLLAFVLTLSDIKFFINLQFKLSINFFYYFFVILIFSLIEFIFFITFFTPPSLSCEQPFFPAT